MMKNIDETDINVNMRQAAYAVIGGCVVGITAISVLDIAVSMGRFIPQSDIVSDYVTAFCWALILGAFIIFFPVSKKDKSGLLIVWFVKIVVTLGFMLIYENNYYGLDSYNYFSRALNDSYDSTVAGFYGTQLVDNLVWLHLRVLPHSYHMLKVSFSFVGLISVFIFYRAAIMFIQKENIRVFYILSFFPSILFWSSILGKDPLIMLGISLCAYGLVAWHRKKSHRYLIVLLSGIFLASIVRMWMAQVLLASLLVFILCGKYRFATKAFVVLAVAAILFFFVSKLQQVFMVESLNDIISTTNDLSRRFATGNTGLTQQTYTSLNSMALYAPVGMFTALFRPLPGEAMNLFGVFAGIENLFLLGLAIIAIKRSSIKDMKDPVIIWAIVTIIVWSVLYGFIAFNLGTTARFKAQILPILLALALYQARNRKTISVKAKKNP